MTLLIILSVLFFSLNVPLLPAWAASILVNTNVLNVRHQPEGKKIGRVFFGQQFRLLGQKKGWGKIRFRSDKNGWVSLNYSRPVAKGHTVSNLVQFCQQLNQEFDRLKWEDALCRPSAWQAEFYSVQGKPLLYSILGQRQPTSLLLCGIHPDENTPYQCFRLFTLLKQDPELLNHRLVIAPLVNPDRFLKKRKTRTNIRGVDLNRNLPTNDWRTLALRTWKHRYSGDKRRYPGPTANSEPENQFVIDLIQRFNPDKVISIHAPYDFLDLDYLDGFKKNAVENKVYKKAKVLALKFSKESKFQFLNYRTFPGSLGRYGNEWKIPIYTVELPSSNPAKSRAYFRRFERSLIHSFTVILGTHRTAMLENSSDSFL